MKQFPKGARVCFVGDSITHIGLFIKHIAAYYRNNFSDLNIEFYNCGIAGGTLTNTLKVYGEDVEIYEPTHIVLMIGVNDSRRTRLLEKASEERYAILLEAYEKYKRNMETFYRLTREKNIELMLCTPMPYAEYQESNAEILHGGFALIQGYAEFVRDFAKKWGLSLCDYHKAITGAMQSEILYKPDRVHPNPRGHAVMAKTFLSELGIDYQVAEGFSEDVEDWYSVTQRLRNVITTEYLTVPDYCNLTNDERYEAVKEKYDAVRSGKCEVDPYIGSLIEAYVTDKPKQAEYVEQVKCFMKNKRG